MEVEPVRWLRHHPVKMPPQGKVLWQTWENISRGGFGDTREASGSGWGGGGGVSVSLPYTVSSTLYSVCLPFGRNVQKLSGGTVLS